MPRGPKGEKRPADVIGKPCPMPTYYRTTLKPTSKKRR
jgi:hypothetical protein